MSHALFSSRFLLLLGLLLWLAEAARPALDHKPESLLQVGSKGTSRQQLQRSSAKAEFRRIELALQSHDLAALQRLDEEAQEEVEDQDGTDEDGPDDTSTKNASQADKAAETSFFKDVASGQQEIKSAMEGYNDVVKKGEERAVNAYDKLGEFQRTITNMTEPLKFLRRKVRSLRKQMLENLEAENKELLSDLESKEEKILDNKTEEDRNSSTSGNTSTDETVDAAKNETSPAVSAEDETDEDLDQDSTDKADQAEEEDTSPSAEEQEENEEDAEQLGAAFADKLGKADDADDDERVIESNAEKKAKKAAGHGELHKGKRAKKLKKGQRAALSTSSTAQEAAGHGELHEGNRAKKLKKVQRAELFTSSTAQEPL